MKLSLIYLISNQRKVVLQAIKLINNMNLFNSITYKVKVKHGLPTRKVTSNLMTIIFKQITTKIIKKTFHHKKTILKKELSLRLLFQNKQDYSNLILSTIVKSLIKDREAKVMMATEIMAQLKCPGQPK